MCLQQRQELEVKVRVLHIWLQVCLDSVKTMGEFQKETWQLPTPRCHVDADLVEGDPIDEPVLALLHQPHAGDAALHPLQLPAELLLVLVQMGPCLETQHQSMSEKPSSRNSIPLRVQTMHLTDSLWSSVRGRCRCGGFALGSKGWLWSQESDGDPEKHYQRPVASATN